MANISELIRSKAEGDQARQSARKMERENLSTMRDAALGEITDKPEKYQQFLTLLGDNIGCSAGNVALTMVQLPHATKIGTTDYWHKLGRYVADEEMSRGAKVFVPSRNANFRGYFMGDYYDVSQTTGRPIRETAPLENDSNRMEVALAALMNKSPVDVSEDTDLSAPAYYNPADLTLYINPEYTDSEVFSALATEIAYARVHDRGRNSDYDRAENKLDAESIGYMICRRFGVDCPTPDASQVKELYEGYEGADISDTLEALRSAARDLGDAVDRAIQPRQQERGRKRYASR